MIKDVCQRVVVDFERELFDAVQAQAAHRGCSISDIVNEAVRISVCEEPHDLAAFEHRPADLVTPYEALLQHLKAHGEF